MDDRVDEWVQKSITSHPERIAVSDASREVTYGQLGAAAETVRELLAGAGVSHGDLVGMRMPRGWRVYAAVLGIWRHGCGYVPVDPSYPRPRQDFVLADAGVHTVVEPGPDGGFVLSDAPVAETSGRRTPEGTAYVLHTSGSTGRPKGVVVSHRSLAAFVRGFVTSLGFGAGEVWAQSTSPCFDVSLAEAWVPLVTGARLIAVSDQTLRHPRSLVDLLIEERATVLSQVPTVFRYLLDAAERTGAAFPELRRVLLAGEAVEPAVVARWADLGISPGATYHNLYGPTEGTVYATWQQLTPGELARWDAPGTPIGRALPHVEVQLRSEGGVVEDGEVGEILLSGGIADCYLDRPELTARAFVRDPDGRVWYRTGDLAVRDADGALRCLGRADRQVKVRGMRVELGEVESRLLACAGVASGAVVAVTGPRGEAMLVGCFVPESAADDALARELPLRMREFLPSHMVPARFVALPSLPLTLSGKLDRGRLEELVRRRRPGSGPAAVATSSGRAR
ncbi:nonribosomal peptide synthetase DhbF [Streptomyces sp. PsTaAH-137]|nr:amino acid adenylation domain-containing protein [Streptomyces sp. SID8367]MYT68232.1 amino acid adenylation domain-containing protein [Streptomyces sp. SID8367]RAJ76864.1 nonribosomal peptide synthetase DhbF [Streptomyces sp. PsTaAH-137]